MPGTWYHSEFHMRHFFEYYYVKAQIYICVSYKYCCTVLFVLSFLFFFAHNSSSTSGFFLILSCWLIMYIRVVLRGGNIFLCIFLRSSTHPSLNCFFPSHPSFLAETLLLGEKIPRYCCSSYFENKILSPDRERGWFK